MSRPLPPSAEIQIREAADSDGAAITTLIGAVFAEYDGVSFLVEELLELRAPASNFRRKGGRMWVAEHEGRLIGSFGIVATHERGVGEFLKVYLSRESRGMGVAKRLLDRALTFARDRNMTAITLWTDSRFLDGHRFYERHGFRRMPGLRSLHGASQSLEYNFRLDALPGSAG
jgi:putative acetyltransferase